MGWAELGLFNSYRSSWEVIHGPFTFSHGICGRKVSERVLRGSFSLSHLASSLRSWSKPLSICWNQPPFRGSLKAQAWRRPFPLAGFLKRCHICHSGCHLNLTIHKVLIVSSSDHLTALEVSSLSSLGVGPGLKPFGWVGLFVNSNRQLGRAIKNSNYVNRPEKNDCLQKSVAITRHNGSQLGWRGFSVIHNSLS